MEYSEIGRSAKFSKSVTSFLKAPTPRARRLHAGSEFSSEIKKAERGRQNDVRHVAQLRMAERLLLSRPGPLGQDLGIHETNVRKHLKSLEANGLFDPAPGPGQDQYLRIKPQTEEVLSDLDRAKTLGLDRAKSSALDRMKSLAPLLMIRI